MVKLVRKILHEEFKDTNDSSNKSSKRGSSRSSRSSRQEHRQQREEIQLSPALLQALKATVDDQQSYASGDHKSQAERSTSSAPQVSAITLALRSMSMPEGNQVDNKSAESTLALMDSIVKSSDDPALLEALQAMLDESDAEGGADYHKETLALVAESIKEKQAAKKALERAAQAESRLQESLKKVAPDLVNDTAAYLESDAGSKANSNNGGSYSNHASPSLASGSTPGYKNPVFKTITKKQETDQGAYENPQFEGRDDVEQEGQVYIRQEQEEKPRKRKNKYKDIAHKKPEIPLIPSYDSCEDDDQSTFFEDGNDSYSHGSGSYYKEAAETLPSSCSSDDSEEDDEEEEEEEVRDGEETKMVDTLFEIESKLSQSVCSSASDQSSRYHHKHHEEVLDDDEEEEEESDSGIGDEDVDSEDEEEQDGPFFASLCQRVPDEDEDDGKMDRTSSRGKQSQQVPSILNCVSGYFVQANEEDEESTDAESIEQQSSEELEEDDDSVRRHRHRRRKEDTRSPRRKEDHRSRRRDDERRSRRSSRHRRRSRH